MWQAFAGDRTTEQAKRDEAVAAQSSRISVRQWPCGAKLRTGSPFGPHPRSGAMLDLIQVSSINTRSRPGAAQGEEASVERSLLHFSVDGTLIEAWASIKSVKPKGGSGEPPAPRRRAHAEAGFRGQKRANDTHA